MSIAQLVAVERDGKPKKVRANGYLPGIIYGREVKDNLDVMFHYSEVANIISQHGQSAKLHVLLKNKKHLALIKDIQRDHLSNKMIHMDIQFTSSKEEIKVKVPIVYEGATELEFKKLILEINKQEIEVAGKAEDVPELIKLDVSGMKAGTLVTPGDLSLGKNVRACNSNENLAAIHKLKEAAEEEEAKAKEETAEA